MTEAIVAAAKACLNTPFKHQGRIAGLGLDCAGLAVHVLNELRLPLIDIKGYGRVPNEGTLKRIMDMQPSLTAIPVSESQAGDFLLIRVSREPSHIAIQSSDDEIIHAYEQVGRTCEHRMDEHWRRNVIAAYRVVA